MERYALLLILGGGLAACAAKVPVTDMAALSPADLTAATNVRVFTTEQTPPKVERAIAPITAFSCKHLTTDPPASKGDALQQLQLKASQVGANAVINVTFDLRGTDTWGTNCWQSVQASGTAVRIKDSRCRAAAWIVRALHAQEEGDVGWA
jgi:hypothetical protein